MFDCSTVRAVNENKSVFHKHREFCLPKPTDTTGLLPLRVGSIARSVWSVQCLGPMAKHDSMLIFINTASPQRKTKPTKSYRHKHTHTYRQRGREHDIDNVTKTGHTTSPKAENPKKPLSLLLILFKRQVHNVCQASNRNVYNGTSYLIWKWFSWWRSNLCRACLAYNKAHLIKKLYKKSS